MKRIAVLAIVAILIAVALGGQARSDEPTGLVSPIMLPIVLRPAAASVPTKTPTPTTTPVPTATPTPEPQLVFGKGIAAAHANPVDLPKLNLDSYYTWGPEAPSWVNEVGAEWLPMVRDNNPMGPDDRDGPDATNVLTGARRLDHDGTVMLFNECEALIGSGQCELDPAEAADLTRQLQATFPDVETWVSPAVHCDFSHWAWACRNQNWLAEYMAACQGCQIDVIAIHFYEWGSPYWGYSCSLGDFSRWVDRFRHYGKPIIVTEIACLDDREDVRLAAHQQYYEFAQTDVQIIGFFPWALKADPALFGSWFAIDYVDFATGELTALGEWYKDVYH